MSTYTRRTGSTQEMKPSTAIRLQAVEQVVNEVRAWLKTVD